MIIAFYLFRKPHDCFDCLSKDVSLRISIFQYTNEEQDARETHSKIGVGLNYFSLMESVKSS